MMFRSVAFVLFALGVSLAVEARAERASCDELLAARANGRSDAEIQADYQTTRARLSACERIADHHERLEAQREQLEAERLQRAEARAN